MRQAEEAFGAGDMTVSVEQPPTDSHPRPAGWGTEEQWSTALGEAEHALEGASRKVARLRGELADAIEAQEACQRTFDALWQEGQSE